MDKHAKQIRKEFIRQFYRGNGLLMLLAILRIVVLCGASLGVSWLMQILIDNCTGVSARWTLGQIAGMAAGLLLIFTLGFFLTYHSVPRFVANAMEQYKNYVFTMLSRKSIGAFAGENTSVYISALSNDANRIEEGYLCNLFSLISDGLMFVGALVMMLCYSPLLTALAVLLSLLPAAVSLLAGNRVARAEERVSERNEGYMAAVKDCLSGFSVVKAFQAEDAMCRLFAGQTRAVHDAKCASQRVMVLIQGLGTVAGVTTQFGVFLIGAWMAEKDWGITAGVVIAFVNLMNMVINPISTIPQYLAQRKAARALIDKLALALSQNVREEGIPVPAKLEQGITLEHVNFGYGEELVLRDITAHFAAGGCYAIVGASGSGKSTLLNLLLAAHDTYSGTIRYDDLELRGIRSDSLYTLVSTVQQNVFVFNASIRDNITMFRAFPREEVDRAIALSGLTELIRERGEEYLCGENGNGLSGGEKQRLSIARSLLRKSSVLLVDEATAALDAKTAWQVSDAILNLEGLTRIVITHSLEAGMLSRCDGILVMKAGAIVETGTFEELMEQKGYFYSLYTVSK